MLRGVCVGNYTWLPRDPTYARVCDPARSLFLTPSLPPSSEKVKLKATCMMAKVQLWNVSVVCVQFKNNMSRRVQSLQVAPLGLLLFQSRDIYSRKRWKWWGNRVHMLGKYAGRDWRKNNILPQVAALFLNFFFPFRLEPAIFVLFQAPSVVSWQLAREDWNLAWKIGHGSCYFQEERSKNSHNGQNSQAWVLLGYCFVEHQCRIF